MKKQTGSGRKGAPRRKSGKGPDLALAIVTCINLALTLALAVLRRQDTLRAIQGDGKVRVLLEQADNKKRN